MKYLVYAEWYGSKKKISVVAESSEQARKMVTEKIIVHKITREEEPDETVEMLKNIFGISA